VKIGDIAPWVAAAVLLFWAVGAYNRLVRLRSEILRHFSSLDAQYRLRHGLLGRLADAFEARADLAPDTTEAVAGLRAAAGQADSALSHARVRPGGIGAVASLRLAEDVLAQARARVAPPAAGDEGLAALAGELSAADATISFARRQFNDAVSEYNRAVQQFPTWLMAALFRFRTAGLL